MGVACCQERKKICRRPESIFHKYDRDGSGEIDANELHQFFREVLGTVLSDEELEALVVDLDYDKSGTVGLHELRAFLRCCDLDEKTIRRRSALIIIDVQNDFITGSLANQYNAVEIISVINEIRDAFDLVVISYDWHPYQHCSFVESANDGHVSIKEDVTRFEPFSQVTLLQDADREEHTQMLYPRHAVQGTSGAECHKDLVLQESDKSVYKGTKPNIDSYSAFFDNCKANDTGLTTLLELANITDVYCCGLVFDICVRASALHGAEMGFRTRVIEDACKPLSMDNVNATKKQLDDAGVTVLSSQEAMAELKKPHIMTFRDHLQEIKVHKRAQSLHNQLNMSSHRDTANSGERVFDHSKASELFSKYDSNADGQLDVKELGVFLADAFADITLTKQDQELLFKELDTDSSGTISLSELRAFLRLFNSTRSTKTVKRKTALIIIDVQNDFITGSLANPYNAKEIVPIINGIRSGFDLVVISYDWHPYQHCSFVESVNDGVVPIKEQLQKFDPFTQVTLEGDSDREEHKQTLYPRHAVQDSEGGKCHPELVLKDSDKRINKGTKPNIDSYSAFFDNCKANDTGLTGMLDGEGVTDVYCCGLVTDICVKSSALHGAEMGFRTYVIEDACKPLNMDDMAKTRETLAAAGVTMISSEDAMKEMGKTRECTLREYLNDVRKNRGAKGLHLQEDLASHSPKWGPGDSPKRRAGPGDSPRGRAGTGESPRPTPGNSPRPTPGNSPRGRPVKSLLGRARKLSHQEMQAIFEAYDRDGNAELDALELKGFLNDAFPGSNPTGEELKDIIDELDVDLNGTVGMNELRAFLRCCDFNEKKIKHKTALIIIDVQNDFITGTLASKFDAKSIVPIINDIRGEFDLVVISYDWHPHEHCSFVESVNYGEVAIKEPLKNFQAFEKVTLKGDADRAEHEQVLYPRHCVQNTDGSKCHPELLLKDSDKAVYKGTKPNIDSYSAFFDNCKASDTGLTALLEEEEVTHVYCCGLVLDICVKFSALHGAEMGFRTAVIDDACKPLSNETADVAREALGKAGVMLLSSSEALADIRKTRDGSLKEYLQEVKEHKAAKTIHNNLVKPSVGAHSH